MNANKDTQKAEPEKTTSVSQTSENTIQQPTLLRTGHRIVAHWVSFSLKYPKSWVTTKNPDDCSNSAETGNFHDWQQQ